MVPLASVIASLSESVQKSCEELGVKWGASSDGFSSTHEPTQHQPRTVLETYKLLKKANSGTTAAFQKQRDCASAEPQERTVANKVGPAAATPSGVGQTVKAFDVKAEAFGQEQSVYVSTPVTPVDQTSPSL